jgi:type III secretion protein J
VPFRMLAFVPWLALASAGCAVPVAAGLDEADANRVVVALDQAGIDASKEADPSAEGKFRVDVPREDAARALTAMAEEQLPRVRARGLDQATRGQLVPSRAAEHAHLSRGLAGELERTLGDIDGVLAARVHLNLPAHDAFRDAVPEKASASVLLEHRGEASPLPPEAIQRLVAGGAPGLAPPDVAVVFVPRPSRPAAARSDLARVGPIAVARSSMTALKIAFAVLALAILALAGLTLGLYTRLARLRPGPLPGAGPGHGPAR